VRRLIVSEFVTLDGVIEAPGFEEHRAGRNGWALRLSDEEMQAYNLEQMETAGALMLGRTTYQIFAAFWPFARLTDRFTARMNSMPKYVVSKTIEHADWQNTTVISGDLHAEVEALKDQPGGDIVVIGSADLVAGLMHHDLIDEYRFMVFPVFLGSGKRLFPEHADLRHLRLVGSRAFGSGVVLLTYRPEQGVPTSPYLDDYVWSQEQIRSLHAAQDTNRVLATVMFTDIVDSTGKAAALGDRRWRQLLDNHDHAARLEVERWHGQLVKSTGDGILATFDAPTRALRCAVALRDAVATMELDIRAAIHTGEIEMRDGDVGGIAVHIAARALDTAGTHQVVVTRTVRDLATGTDLVFTPLGSVGLRGMPGEWELFSAASD
jgi:class 3 adenylate cyclase/dihydrofolate reductase